MSTDITLKVTEIQRFCMHDGPGIRTTVFLKGCPLRCAWCHNPETQKGREELLFYKGKCIGCGGCADACPNQAHLISDVHTLKRERCTACGRCVESCPTGALELCGKDMSIDEILSVIRKDSAFYAKTGGVTLSGGEPLLQGQNTLALLEACKKAGFSTALESCGYADAEYIRKAVPFVDLFLWDVKDTDDVRHKQYTGVSNKRILENLHLASELGAKIRLRCILVNGVNTDCDHYLRVAEIAEDIARLEGVQWIPYHAYAGTKATFIGKKDNGNPDWIPTQEQLEQAKKTLENRKIRVF